MTFMPVLEQRWGKRGWYRLAQIGAWVGYTWMGLSFLFFWVSVVLFLAAAVVRWGIGGGGLSTHGWYVLACWLTAAVAVYGFIAARRVRVERLRLTTAKLRPGRPLRIALISDVHLGALVGRRRLAAILRRLEAVAPDVLVSTGDLVDGQAYHVDGLAPMLAGYRPPGGKFAVTGNHEYFIGIDHAVDFHHRAGFTLLRGEAAAVGDVTIAGVDDPTGRRLGKGAATDEPALLARCPQERFTILLKHQPRIDARVAGRFDLQLSGHVHRGQIFPFVLLVRLFYPLGTGLKRLTDRTWLYVSRGTGTWGPPMRVAAAPEVTVIEIAPAE